MESSTEQGYQRSLAALLREELGFYRSLYVLLDRQRDWLKYDRDSKILDIFEDIEKLKNRIKQSQEKIQSSRQQQPQRFQRALAAPEISRLVDNIVTLISKCVDLANENESIATAKRDRLKSELADLTAADRFFNALKHENAPRYVDQRH
jgi:hypothetical protein